MRLAPKPGSGARDKSRASVPRNAAFGARPAIAPQPRLRKLLQQKLQRAFREQEHVLVAVAFAGLQRHRLLDLAARRDTGHRKAAVAGGIAIGVAAALGVDRPGGAGFRQAPGGLEPLADAVG